MWKFFIELNVTSGNHLGSPSYVPNRPSLEYCRMNGQETIGLEH